jgi:hypothetical protein
MALRVCNDVEFHPRADLLKNEFRARRATATDAIIEAADMVNGASYDATWRNVTGDHERTQQDEAGKTHTDR